MADQEEDFSSLPLTDRFAHKNWKVRKEAYEAAAKEFDNAQSESDPTVKQFTQDPSIWKTAVADSNAAAHQEALASLCSYLQIAGTHGCTRTRNMVVPLLAEKGLIAARPAPKQKSLEAILLYVELDKAEPVIDDLIPLLSHKLPKIVAAVLSSFTSIYHAYGTKTVDPKPVLKCLPNAYGHADKNVRAEAQNLTVELYRWLRESMKPLFWNDLKPVQQTDLEKLFEPVKAELAPKPERLLKSQQAAVEAKAQAVADGEGEEEEEAEAEAEGEPEMIAVDVFPRIPKDLQDRLGSSKWKDRKDVLDELHTAVDAPAIEDGPFDDILRALGPKCMKDANIAVVTVAANCIELIAHGLRRGFAKYRSTVFSPIMERLKERKQTVTDALCGALDAVCASTSLTENLEESLGFLAHKNPQVKLEATRFFARNLKSTREAPSIPDTKLIAEAASKTLTDSQETQRNAGAEVLGVLWKIMGDRVMNTHLDGLDEIRKAKIKEYMEAAEVKSKYKPKAAPAPKPTAAATTAQKKPAGKKPATTATKKPPPKPSPPSPAFDENPPELQPKPTVRPATIARPAAAGAGRGLRPPGSALPGKKPAPGPYAQSPTRRAPQASPDQELHSPPTAKPAARGLTGRTLAKPALDSAPSQAQPATTTHAPQPSIDRIELDALRGEADRLRAANETLRTDNSKLHSQVNELQNQNAQLIEDHTRDVLSIKAKETQLVRARSDAESAEQSATQLTREVERLKRELGRMGRATTPRASDGAPGIGALDAGLGYEATSVSRGGSAGGRSAGVMSPTRGSVNEVPALSPARPQQYDRPPSHASNDGRRPASRPRHQLANGDGNAQPMRPQPVSPEGGDGRSSASSRGQIDGDISKRKPNGAGTGAGVGEGVESWKRAAEVTQNLKARIELMKARQAQQQAGR